MTTEAKRAVRRRAPRTTDRVVVYRGIRIAPIAGKRSAFAKALRKALREERRSSQPEPAHS
jgi:hypothetical protein